MYQKYKNKENKIYLIYKILFLQHIIFAYIIVIY